MRHRHIATSRIGTSQLRVLSTHLILVHRRGLSLCIIDASRLHSLGCISSISNTSKFRLTLAHLKLEQVMLTPRASRLHATSTHLNLVHQRTSVSSIIEASQLHVLMCLSSAHHCALVSYVVDAARLHTLAHLKLVNERTSALHFIDASQLHSLGHVSVTSNASKLCVTSTHLNLACVLSTLSVSRLRTMSTTQRISTLHIGAPRLCASPMHLDFVASGASR